MSVCASTVAKRLSTVLSAAVLAFVAIAAPPAFEKTSRPYPDLGLSFAPLVDAIGEPLCLPSASAFLVTVGDTRRMEDRYDTADLWYGATVRARWSDPSGNRLSIARLDTRFPDDPEGTLKTRRAYYEDALPIEPRERERVRDAALMAAPFETGVWEKPRRSRRAFMDAVYCPATTNACRVARVFRPVSDRKGGAPWYAAYLEIADEADAPAAVEALDDWLDGVRELTSESAPRARKGKPAAEPTEFELLARDFTANVTNCANWTVSAAEGCLVADELAAAPGRAELVAALTNDLPRFQTAYAERLPTPLAGAVPPAATRIFAGRDAYLAYVGEELAWSAAVWSVERRELALYLPEDGKDALLATVWHEALHQYLDYACATLQCAPWFNEGHAQLFQHAKIVAKRPAARGSEEERRDWRIEFGYDPDDMAFVRANAVKLAEMIPSLLAMDYNAFYANDLPDGKAADAIRRCNYRLAWSVAYFLEVGAPEVRFRPFADVRRGYLEALMKTRRMDHATRSVLSGELLKDLADEWLRFFRER